MDAMQPLLNHRVTGGDLIKNSKISVNTVIGKKNILQMAQMFYGNILRMSFQIALLKGFLLRKPMKSVSSLSEGAISFYR